MKTDRLQDALGMIRDDYVLDAHDERRTDKKIWRRWGTLAACLCLAAVCAIGVPKLLHRGTPANPQQPPVKPYAPDIGQYTPVDPGTDPAPVPGPDDNPIPIPGPQTSYDWPVIYNEVDTMPDAAHYVAIANRALTEAEKDAVIPACLGSLKLENAYANFDGPLYEDGRLDEDARLDSVELRFTDPDRGYEVRVGLWPAGQTSLFSWAAQFNPAGTQATNFDSDQDPLFLSLFRYEDAVWTYFTVDGVSYYVGADAAFRDGISDSFYQLVLALLRTDDTPDLSILVPNP